jgi:anti-anti-sigma factor
MSEALATVEVRQEGGTAVVTVKGEVDLSNVNELEAQIEEAIQGAGSVVLDLESVEYMDSRGVRLVHALSRRLRSHAVDFRVLAPADSIAGEVLRLTNLAGLEPDDLPA